jgi:hypothetical protein
MISLRQSQKGFFQASTSPLTFTTQFPSDTLLGSLLVAVVVGEIDKTSLISGTLSASTPGIVWSPVDSGSCSDSYVASSGPYAGTLFQTWGGVAIFYSANAPMVPAATVTTLSLSGSADLSVPPFSPLISVGIFEFTGIPAVSIAAIVAATYNNGFGGALDSSSPTKELISAGALTTFGHELVVVASSTHASHGLGTGYSGDGLLSFGSMQYITDAPSGGVDTAFSATSTAAKFACIAVAFGPLIATGGSCGDCPGPHLLELIPGFSDLPDSVLSADDPAFALHLGEIAFNATFGMVRCEVFACPCKHDAIVPLPVSCWDGYKYSRSELTYLWGVQSSLDPSTNWISGPDSLWFMNWNVNQDTGQVFSEEWYERSSAADSRLAAKSNDGQLLVFTVGQRQKDSMIMAEAAAYTAIDESKIAIDKPVAQDLMQQLNQDAKFSCVNSEVFYLGEYTNGQTVTLPISPVDGYVYVAGECQFQHCWRWTASGASYVQPPGSDEQAAPFLASINSSGAVSITVKFATDGGEGNVIETNYGRIAAFAFCTRSATPTSGTLADDFTELALDFFAPGATVRASEVLTIKRNIDEAILSPEFFGPTDYADAQTVALPTSPVDGYSYSRSEVQYIWSWSDTTNSAPGNPRIRLPLFLGSVDPASGLVKLRVWRLPPGGPFLDDNNTFARIKVLVMATRQAIHPEITPGTGEANLPADAGTFATDRGSLVNGS